MEKKYIIALITVPDQETGEMIANILLEKKHMHKKHSQEPQSLGQRIKGKLISILPKGFIRTVPIIGLCLAPLYFLTGERLVVYLLVAFSITYLIAGGVSLITMTRTYGWQVRVEVLVDFGEILGVMVFLLLTVVSLLVQFLSST